MLYYILWILDFIIIKSLFNVKIKGRGNIPKRGGCLVAVDHSDIVDPLFVSLLTYRRMYNFVKHDAYYPGKDSPFYHKFAFLLRWTGQIPVEKNKGVSENYVKYAVNLIKKGNIFVIYPEGTSESGEHITDPKRGVARIALKARIPVIPVGLVNTEGIIPKGKVFFQKYPDVKIKVGKPLDYKKYYDRGNNRKITKIIANDVMKHIKKLCVEARKI